MLFIGDTDLQNKLQVHMSDQQIEDHFTISSRYHEFQADHGAHSPPSFCILNSCKVSTKEHGKRD